MKLRNFYLIAAMLAVPAASFATDHYISPNGKGNGDGTSWDDAMSFSDLLDKINTYDDGDVYYFAGGTYYPPKIVGITKGCTFIGGFNPDLTGTENTTPTYPSATPTVFSGDVDKDGMNSNGDLDRLLAFNQSNVTATENQNTKITLTGLEFKDAYSVSSTTTHGALFLRGCYNVEVNNCRFYDNVEDKYYGGMALTSEYSTLYMNDCEFTNNKAKARGGAIRLSSNDKAKGITVLNRCLIANNSTEENIGSAICVQQGKSLYIINSTITGCTSGTTGGAVYSNGSDDTYTRNVYIVNSTIAGNDGGPQVQMTTNANLYVANSIVVSDGETAAFSIGSVKNFVSGGMNVVGTEENNGLSWIGTDNAGAGNNYAAVFGENVLGDNGVIEPLATEGEYTADALQVAIADWDIDADVTIDQTGNTRAEHSTPGAYAKTISSGITAVEVENGNEDAAYYTLQGIKLGARPTAAGIYIHNGKKIIIK